MEQNKVDRVALQETRWKGSRGTNGNSFKMLYSGKKTGQKWSSIYDDEEINERNDWI